jgi:hypothetical protein
MALRLSQLNDNSKIITSNVTLKLQDYGTISDTGTHEAAVSNAAIFRKAYQDALNMRFVMHDAVTCYIECPPGDYYFGDNPSGNANFYTLTFNHPQADNISIRGTTTGTKPSNASLDNASTVTDRYNLLKAYYKTRFHFARNGIYGRLNGTAGGRGPGFHKIGIFGRYNGQPGTFNTSSSIFARGIAGTLRLEYCCVHGFGAGSNANNWGISADSSFIDTYDVQVIDCHRALKVSNNGSISSFGDLSCIHNTGPDGNGIVATDGGMVYFAGEGTGYISRSSTQGVIVYSGGIVRFGNGGTHIVRNSVNQDLYTDSYGLIISSPRGIVSYSTRYDGGLIRV